MFKALLLRCFYLFIMAATVAPALAAIDVHEFSNDVERQRYQSFIDEMRCPKCQNQNLSGSDSPIAADLRNQLYAMIKDGRSDKEIVDFMVDRYGEFILYRPRLTPTTLLLWILPGALLLLGAGILILIVRKRRTAALVPNSLTTEEQGKLDALLGSSEHAASSNDNKNAENEGVNQ